MFTYDFLDGFSMGNEGPSWAVHWLENHDKQALATPKVGSSAISSGIGIAKPLHVFPEYDPKPVHSLIHYSCNML